MAFKIAELNLNSGKNNTVSEVFVAQPDAIRERLAGKLFLVLEMPDQRQDTLKFVNFLVDKLNFNYYQNDKIVLMERLSTIKTEHIFEVALAKTNKQLAEYLKDERSRIDLDKVSATAGVVAEGEVLLANSGRNKALLVYRKGGGEAGGARFESAEYQVADIAKPGKEEKGARSGAAGLFTSVISGRIPERSALLVVNEALPEYLSQKQIVEIVSTLPPAGAVEQIKAIISRVNSYVPFAGLVIKSSLLDRPAMPPLARPSTQESVATLNATEDKTEALLSPSRLFNWRDWLPGGRGRAGQREDGGQAAMRLELRDRVYFQKRSASYLKKAGALSLAVAASLAHIAGSLWRWLREPGRLERLGAGLVEGPARLAASARAAYQGAGQKTRYLAALVLALSAFLAYNIISHQRQAKREAEAQRYQALTAEIEKKQLQAEANLLYSNDEGAMKLFDEISALMQELPQVSDVQKSKFSELEAKFEAQREKTRKVVRADGAEELADYGKLNARAKPSNLAIAPGGGILLAADTDDKSVYIVDGSDRSVTTAATLDQAVVRLDSPAFLSENELLYLDQGGLTGFSPATKEFSRVSANFLGQDSYLKALDAYGGKVYILNPEERQIYRYNKSGAALSSPYAWVQDGKGLEKAVDLAIDGQIYALLSDGQAIKFLRGQPVDFRLEACDPALASPTRIATTQEGGYLYVLEPAGQRLLVYDKDGQFIAQYYADKFDRLEDFAIDEAGKKAYVLNGTKLYMFGLTHIE